MKKKMDHINGVINAEMKLKKLLLFVAACVLVALFMFASEDAFADGVTNHTASYNGKPTISRYDDYKTNEPDCYINDYKIEPKTGDAITINKNGSEETYTYNGGTQNGGPAFSNGTEVIHIAYVPWVADDKSEAMLFVDANDNGLFTKVTVKSFTYNDTISKIVFEPQRINLKASDFKNGLSFDERVYHQTAINSWYSPFDIGDKMTVYFSNGRAPMTFENKLRLENGYSRDRFMNGDKYIDIYNETNKLSPGKNTVKLSWGSVSTEIEVNVESDQNSQQSVSVRKKVNPIKVTAKTATVKYKKLKKKTQKLSMSKVIAVSNAQGKVTYKKISGNKKILINNKIRKVTLKKGLKKGTYKVKVKVTAAGNSDYKAKSKTVTFRVKVR